MDVSRQNLNKINKLHERALRIVYNNYELSFHELLFIDRSYSIHHRNIQPLSIELYKNINGLSPEIVNNIFDKSVHQDRDFKRVRSRTVIFGDNLLQCFGPIVWDMLPNEIKMSKTLSVFR